MRPAWLLLLPFLACSGDAPPTAGPPAGTVGGTVGGTAQTSAEWREGLSRTGATRVRWRPRSGSIPFNEYFELEVEIERAEDGATLQGAQVFVRCEMPAHGHGMNVEPRAQEVAPGRYRVEGMLLHMRGEWLLAVDVVVDRRAESAEFPLTIE